MAINNRYCIIKTVNRHHLKKSFVAHIMIKPIVETDTFMTSRCITCKYHSLTSWGVIYIVIFLDSLN